MKNAVPFSIIIIFLLATVNVSLAEMIHRSEYSYFFDFSLYEKQAIGKENDGVAVVARGTGRTTGHIADLIVSNNTSQPIEILPERMYIPSDGKYQSYVAWIEEGIIIPPGETHTIPVHGYCADVHTPPVPSGDLMPPLNSWIPVSENPLNDLVGPPPSDPDLGPAPQIPEPMNPPGANDVAPQVPEPMNPPGANDSEPTVPEPMNPPGGSAPPTEGVPVRLLPRDPVPPFTPELIPEVPLTPLDRPDNTIIVTYPGTDIPIDGTIDPAEDPVVYGTILVEAVDQLEEAYEVIRESESYPTPYFPDPIREGESVVQQGLWIYTAAITGDDYEQEDFEAKVYEQFETTTGKSVDELVQEQKEQVDQGIEDFWVAFQATGVEAKIFSVDSPDLIDADGILMTVSTPKCKCDNITFDLEVKRGATVVHSGSHSSDTNPVAKIKDFKFGDKLDIKITNIQVHCKCDEADCAFYPAESTNSNSPGYTTPDTSRPGKVDIFMDNDGSGVIGDYGNNNCQHKDKAWNSDGTEYSFTLETRDENTNNKSVFQKLRIKSYCQLDDCRKKLCAEVIQLSFVTAK